MDGLKLAKLAHTDAAIEAWEAEAQRCARKATQWADRGEEAVRVARALRQRRRRELAEAFSDPPGGEAGGA